MALFETGKKIAEGAAMMTDTKLDTVMILGSGWSGHFSKPIAEAMNQNIQKVGMPKWDENDETLAKGIQRELGSPEEGLNKEGEQAIAWCRDVAELDGWRVGRYW